MQRGEVLHVVRLVRQDRREVHAMACDLEHLTNRAASWEHTKTPVQHSKVQILCPQMTGHVLVLPPLHADACHRCTSRELWADPNDPSPSSKISLVSRRLGSSSMCDSAPPSSRPEPSLSSGPEGCCLSHPVRVSIKSRSPHQFGPSWRARFIAVHIGSFTPNV